MTADITKSNSLTDLAARIKAEHEAVSVALKDSVRHAITAGELLVEAKAQIEHGQWLPWLKDHCTISERTAQLYMRCAKNRTEIEANTQHVADLTLNEAAAMLALSSDMKKLFDFVKQVDKLNDPEEIIQFCAENDVAVLQGNVFNAPEPTAQESVEWGIYQLFLIKKCGFSPESASQHADWVQSRGSLLSDWMGPHGTKFFKTWGVGPSPDAIEGWKPFLEANKGRTLEDVSAEFEREDIARRDQVKRLLAGKLSKKNRRLLEQEANHRGWSALK